MDPVGAFLANLHSIVGHDTAAAMVGSAPGERAGCVLCLFAAGKATREDVEAALASGPAPVKQSTDLPEPAREEPNP